jgi:hypothetical protein
MKSLTLFSVLLLILNVGHAYASDFFIYPSKGQSQAQMEKDKGECYRWAVQNTGFDPSKTPRATTPPPINEPETGGVVSGAARGAALGAIAGAIAGDAGKGAAIGAATGGLFGGMRRSDTIRRNKARQQEWERQQQQIYRQKKMDFDRAYSACLMGRGYTVN